MPKVNSLTILIQENSEQYYATWKFGNKTSSGSGSGSGSGSTSSGGTVKVGSLVTIKSGAKYYNGVSIPSFVMKLKWYVVQVSGNRAVLGKDSTGKYNIQSAVNTKDLTVVGSSGGSSGGGSSGGSTSSAELEQLDHYEVKWWYSVGGVWFIGNETDVKYTNSTYSPPSNATRIKVSVKPVSKTYEVKTKNETKEVSYWTGTAVYAEHDTSEAMSKPPAPTVIIEGFRLKASLENISEPRASHVQFQVFNGNQNLYPIGEPSILQRHCSFSMAITPGGQYRVRCRYLTIEGSGVRHFGPWGDYSGESKTIPLAVTGLTCQADSKNSIKVSWTAVESATSYEIQYATKEEYFDSSSEVKNATVTSTTAYLTGLDADEWFIRVRAINAVGNSAWSSIISTVVGAIPEAPTTWSLTTTAVVGENLVLYWVHNVEDKSRMTEAEIYIEANGSSRTITIPGKDKSEDDEDTPIYSYTVDTTQYEDGATLKWKVRTAGLTGEYGDWSTQRTIKIYAPPTLLIAASLNDNEELTSLPFTIDASAGPNTQTPISYHVSIVANGSYESTDVVGVPIKISAGNELFSKVYNTSDADFTINLSAGDLLLENGQTYVLSVLVSMDSGLTAETSITFTVKWADYEYYPNASVSIDNDSLCAFIIPFCVDGEGKIPENVTLAVYRREYNGTFVELMTGLANDEVSSITDPHPALDYARYRIVAQETTTGAIFYEDLPGYPVGESAIVIQWDGNYSNLEEPISDEYEFRPWNGSMVRLPGNVDISEKHDADVSLIEYIGRRHPVSYYGTQRGETASWKTDVPKSDKETLYALRRLSDWASDVYVREPSGTGYWARVSLSWNINHLATVIPVTIEIKRVEGSDRQ